ncbi:hypothetical protein [Sphingobacterium faecium]|uniref:hypothetical protein n=1 Tax=Sphingobacterium faecium TaxID=34087 RepID=UPI002469556C|nr:hypothetical protein [Sphingobacterium faecium]MDH5828062.1 hypothetical protein [Sphingobacterium faecium]
MLLGYKLNNEETLQAFIRYEFIEILVEGLSMIHRLSGSFYFPDLQLLHSYNLSEENYSPSKDSINNAIGYFNNCYTSELFELSAYSLQFLNETESRHPLGVIKEFFKFHSLPQWRDALYWWLVVSMDYTSSEDSRGDAYLKEIYENLRRVIEAAQLIYSWNMEKWPRLFAT